MATEGAADLQRALWDSVAARFPSREETPRLAELVKPPGGAGERVSPFTFVRLEDDTLGVSWNLLDDDAQRVAYDDLADAGFRGRPAGELAELFLAVDRPTRIIGYACLNALCQILVREGRVRTRADVDLLDLMAPGPDDHVGLVGFSPPLVRKLSQRAGRVTVLEKEPREAKQPNVTVSPEPAALAPCTKILVTSTTLLNDSFLTIDAVTKSAEFRALYGPGAGILPDLFFARGYAALAGIRVLDPALLLERQRAGKKWGDAKEKCLLVP